ncbi:MAG: hypothetical protein LM590_12500 [Thermofilum sp.]|nr:hypothetical protein [Thermofilum sp.]
MQMVSGELESAARSVEYKTVLAMILVVVFISHLSAFWAAILRVSGVAEFLESPFVPEEGLRGAVINSFIVLLLVLLGTGLLLTLIRLRKVHIIPGVMAIAVAFSFWGVAEIYFYSLSQFDEALLQYADILSVALAVSTALLIFRPISAGLLNALLLVYGTMSGSLLSVALPGWSVYTLAVLLAAYDIYSVFRGPLKRILESTVGEGQSRESKIKSPLRGAVIVVGNLALGMGDVLIYSMLSAAYLYFPHFSVARWVAATAALATGLYLTLGMLKHRKYMPALPLPVLLSLTVYILCLLLKI